MRPHVSCAAFIAALTVCVAPAAAQDAPAAAAAPPPAAPASASDEPAADAPAAPVPATPAPAATVAEPAARQPAAAAQAPAAAISANLTPPPAGKGQVAFFRPSRFVGAAVGFKVRENGEELGKLTNGAYFVHVTDPGAHTYVVHSEAQDKLTLEVEPGETYYVTGNITMGVMVGRPNISPTDQAAFDAAFPKLKMSSLEPKKAK